MSNNEDYRIDQINFSNGINPALFNSVYRMNNSSNQSYQYGLNAQPSFMGREVRNDLNVSNMNPFQSELNESSYRYPSLEQVKNAPLEKIPEEFLRSKNKSHLFLSSKMLLGHIVTGYILFESAERRIYPIMKNGVLYEIGAEEEASYLLSPEGELFFYNSLLQTIEIFEFEEENSLFQFKGDFAIQMGPLYSPIFYLVSQITKELEERKYLLLIGGKAQNGEFSHLIHMYDLKDMDSYKGFINMVNGRARPLVFHDKDNLYIIGGCKNKAENKVAEFLSFNSIFTSCFHDLEMNKLEVKLNKFTISINSLFNSGTICFEENKWLIIRRNRTKILEIKKIDLNAKVIQIGYFQKKLVSPIDYNLSNENVMFLKPYIVIMVNDKPYVSKTKIVKE